jgi:hypothetical protein
MILVTGLHSNFAIMWVDLRDECHDINWTWVQGMQCGRFGGIGSGGSVIFCWLISRLGCCGGEEK